jgi:hypothetical protein
MIDGPEALRNFLVAQPALIALVGDRVWAETSTPAAGYKPSDGPAICFMTRGGRDDYTDVIIIPSVQFKVYGSSEIVANEAYRVLHDALHNGKGYGVRWGRCEVLGQTLREPETEWIFILTFFTIWIANG